MLSNSWRGYKFDGWKMYNFVNLFIFLWPFCTEQISCYSNLRWNLGTQELVSIGRSRSRPFSLHIIFIPLLTKSLKTPLIFRRISTCYPWSQAVRSRTMVRWRRSWSWGYHASLPPPSTTPQFTSTWAEPSTPHHWRRWLRKCLFLVY